MVHILKSREFTKGVNSNEMIDNLNLMDYAFAMPFEFESM